MSSPLGQYAQIVAAISAVGVISAWVVAAFLQGLGLFVDPTAVGSLENIALIAIGAVFGSAVAVNGYKQPVATAASRIDRLEAAAMGVPNPNATTTPY